MIVTVLVLMKLIVVTLNLNHHQLKEGAVPGVDEVSRVLHFGEIY